MPADIFPILILVARPAAGKSEVIHYLKNTPLADRRQRFHVGQIEEIDDFPMLWTWFEEDDLLSQMGKERLHTTPEGYFRWNHLWDLLIRRISLEYAKQQRDPNPDATTLVEFARGSEHGGFRSAFQHLSPEILDRAAVLYIDVPWEESLRKNRRRFNPDRPDSILEHGLSDDKMERLYREVDWAEFSGGERKGCLTVGQSRLPFVVFENHDDVTTPGGAPLGERLEARLEELWALYGQSSG
ncbi:MAG TPA: hypothetical protein VFF68_09060 [Anaerolineaceae bacterium]|nr:hypothetical protein [Anaerolineaceae bacterium]